MPDRSASDEPPDRPAADRQGDRARDPDAAITDELRARFGAAPAGRAVEIYLAARGYDAARVARVLARLAADDGEPATPDDVGNVTAPAAATNDAPDAPAARPLRAWAPHERARFTPEAWGHLLQLRAAGLGDPEFEHLVDRALLQLDGPVTPAELRALVGDALGPGDPGRATVH